MIVYMNTNDLKIFEAVAEHQSFTKAARSMFTVQSNVTARIKSLEEEFGAELFDRDSRRIALTPSGKILMRYCKQIGQLLDEAKSSIKNSGTVAGMLKIGCIETTMALKAPEILRQFEEKFPAVELEFRSAMRNKLIDEVLNYELDAAFVSAPVSVKGLEQLPVMEERLTILSAAKGPELKDLMMDQPVRIVVFAEGCIFRERLETWLSAQGVVQYKSTVLNSIEGIINFVEAGIGISILPEDIITQYYPERQIRMQPLNKQLGTMNTVLIHRSEGMPSSALQAFLDTYQ
jgi:LysR family transcriptional regulator, cell division regulator